MKIKLTQNKETPVGSQDYKYLSQWNWYYLKDRKGGYAARTIRVNGRCKKIYMHRVILERMGYKNFQKGDHIDRNKLNNLRSNLRPATYGQSSHNTSKRSNTTSEYKGVSWNKRIEKWQVQICMDRKCIYLGLFDSEIKAAKAYNQAAKKHHGKFAVLNGV